MKRGILTAGAFIVIACAVTAYCWAAGHESLSEQTTDAKTTVSEQQTEPAADAANGKSLVVYFSVPETDGVDASSGASRVFSEGKIMGNTQYVATLISEATGSDLFEIKTAHSYPGSHKALIDAAKVEIDNNARPKLATHITNLKDYDVVFLGFPNWWYTLPMAVLSFVEKYDFSGKIVVPFVTHGTSGLASTIRDLTAALPSDVTILDPIGVYRPEVDQSRSAVQEWIAGLDLEI